jgi:O-antigen/teichoic acid export membrane protein
MPIVENNIGLNPGPVAVEAVPLGAKIMRSVLFGGLRYVLIAPIPFLMTPLILHQIGVAGYGTWAVFLAINGLTSLADLGLVGTLSKFVADHHARRDFPALSGLLSSGLTLFLSLACVIAATFWCTAPILASRLFHGSAADRSEVIYLLRCFVLVITANILTQLFSSVTNGLQRLDLTNLVSTGNALLNALFGAFLLLRGWGLRGLVYGYIASGFVTVAIYLVVVKKLLPEIALNPLRFDPGEGRKMFGYSLRLYITQAAVVVHNQVEKVFLAMLVGVAPVGWYEIGSDVALKIRGCIGIILSPVLPAASELNALGDKSRMRELYFRAHKYLAVCGVPAVCYAVSVSHRFVELWLGPSMAMIALPLNVLLVTNFVNLASGPGFLIFAGIGYLKPGIKSAMFGLVLNIVLSLGLIYKFGFPGAVVGTSVSLILASVYFVSMFHTRTGYSLLRVLQESYFKPIVCSTLAMAVLVAIRSPHDLSWLGLAGMGAAFGLFYAAAILLSRFFDDYDWSRLESFLPVARRARGIFRIA